MKVEKINNSKARIVLTLDELKARQISLKDIQEGKEKAQNFFFELLEDCNLSEDFQADTTKLLIEATSKDNLFMITITKADCIPDIKEYSNKKNNAFLYTVSSNIYKFNLIENLYSFCETAKNANLFVGTNSLFELNGAYFLLFSDRTIKKASFVKTFSLISEYVDKYYATNIAKTSFKEYANLLIDKSAIEQIQNF